MAFSSEDLQIMDSIIKRYPRSRSAIMPLLHFVQSKAGYVTNEGIEVIAQLLDLEAAEVTAVSTFYTQYKPTPVGEYHVGVCTNTLCAIMGGDAIFASLKDHLGIGNDEVTADERFHWNISNVTLLVITHLLLWLTGSSTTTRQSSLQKI